MLHAPSLSADLIAGTALPLILHHDYETRSSVNLGKVGAHKYAAAPTTEVLCCAYCVGHTPVRLWLPGDPVPAEFIEAGRNPGWIVVAQNDAFESSIEQHIMGPPHGWSVIAQPLHRCTMGMAQALGLPGRLERVATALDLVNEKDVVGHRLMLQMSKPRKLRRGEDQL